MEKTKTKILTECGILIALAAVLSLIKVFKLPWGGSITLLSMLPICLISIRHGVKTGLFSSFVYAVIQLVFGILFDGLLGWGTHGRRTDFLHSSRLHRRVYRSRPCRNVCR